MGCAVVAGHLADRLQALLGGAAWEFKFVTRPSFTIFINAANNFYISIIIKVVI
jgi:hypothetical protein